VFDRPSFLTLLQDAIPVAQPAVSNFEALEGTDAIEENQSLDVVVFWSIQ